MGRKIEK